MIDAKELTERIYDELMGLAGTDDIHPRFPRNKVKNQWVGDPHGNEREHYIYFEIGNKAYRIDVTETERMY